ncbi:hypothetical protein RB653_000555 [Dictyostelium firmibasis]|uniref:Signal recognition particle subunit SRP68 n=1 Tax=Dictyostelium firmibasis TaxID=79012 RepID=A0AAN7Z198_9MYCE
MEPITYDYEELSNSPITNKILEIKQTEQTGQLKNDKITIETSHSLNQLNIFNKYIIKLNKIQNQIKKIIKSNLLLCVWMFINLSSLLMNQSLEENFNFNSYNTLIGCQLIISFAISHFFQKIKKKYQIKQLLDIISNKNNKIEDINSCNDNDNKEEYEINSEDNISLDINIKTNSSKIISITEMIRIIIPLSFIFVINCIFNSKLSESIVEFSKTVVPLTVVGLQFILTKKRYGKSLYYSMIVLVVGSCIFLLEPSESFNQLLPNFKEFILSIIIISFLSLTLIYSHSIFSTRLSTIDPIIIIHYFSPISLIMLIPFIILERSSLNYFIETFQNEKTLNDIYNFLICLIISGIFAYFTFYITFIANKKYNILIMSISRNSKSVLLKLFSSGVFHEPISNSNWLGFFISSAGILISYQNSDIEKDIDNNNDDDNDDRQKQMATTNTPTSPKEDVKKEKFHLDILNFSQTSQIQFGLRLQDYKKYRQYCSKRIQRLRSQLRKQYGKKNYVNKIVLGEETEKQINDTRYLQIALLKCERAWSYAMDLKAQFEKDNDSRIGFHMNRRFGKASRNSIQLYEICKLVADQYTIIEAQAYSSWMASSLSLVKLEFKKALEEINVSKTIYEKLSEQGDHSQKELYQKRIEETEPIIRFCLYNLKNEKNISPNKISENTLSIIDQSLEELKKQEKSSSSSPSSSATSEIITWKSKSIKVDEKLEEKLKNFNEFKKENEKKLPTNVATIDTASNISPIFNVYDKLVYNLINCETIVKNELSTLVRVNLKNKSVKSEIEEQSTKILLAYIMYHKMKYLYERNSILITMMQRVLDGEKVDESAIKKKVKKVTWNDLVRLSTHQVKVYTVMSESRDTDSNKEIARDQDAQLILLKSIRLYYIAVCLAKSSKFSETMAILDRVLSNIQNVRKTNTKNQQILNDTNQLESNIKKQRSQIHANSFIQQLSENQELKNQMSSLSIGGAAVNGDKSKDLISGLDSFDTSFLAEKKLVQLPPQLQPVQAKPIFFDLAFNNVTFPSLDQRKKGSTGTPSKGLFGFWGRG